ncbi:hypothetical protein FACS18949_04570 [Clostridia bacterium]|nr:hypothetical protein FACS18949_04570 [Clostridia bacterium]
MNVFEYVAADWRVFPCHSITANGVCTCGDVNCNSPGKHPRIKGGLLKATTDPETIRNWWTAYPDANIGHRPPEGVVVIDIDKKSGGLETYAALIAEHGQLPATVTAKTGGGGLHLYFRTDKPLPNAVNALPGIDIRTHAGYVLLPPSLHKSGKQYEWSPFCDPSSMTIAPLPEWFYTVLTQNGASERRIPLEVPDEIPDGERNNTLFREACRLREMGHTENEIRGLMVVMNEERCNPPLDADELEIIIGSASKYPIGQMPPTAAKDFAGLAIAKPALKTLCAADVEVKAVSWLWRDVFVQGALNSIQGIAGIGKTFLLCAVSAAVSNGGGVQSANGNTERLQCGKVLYLSGDDDPATTIVPRLNAFNANLDNIHFAPQDALPPIGSAELEQLFAAATPTLAIVDTLQHFLPAKTDLNSANSTTVALQPLKVLAEKYNCSVVVIQHISKISASGNGGYSVNFGIGSAAVNGLFRSVWTLGRLKDDDGKASITRALSPSKTNLVAGDPPSILFDLSLESGFQWAGIDGDITAEQLYSPEKKPAHRPNDRVERAEEVIRDILCAATEPIRVTDLQQQVIDTVGCSERTYKTARKKAGVISSKAGDVWYASLPKDD